MAYAPHQLLQISGTFGPVGDAYEIWSTGIRTVATIDGESGGTTPTELTEEELAAYLVELEDQLLPALASATVATAGNFVKIDMLKYNQIDADGHYLYDTTNQIVVPNAPFGSASTGLVYPTQVAKVLTLETGFTRGLAHRGRMYIPGPVNAMDDDTGTFTIGAGEMAAWAVVVGNLRGTITRGADTITVAPAVVSGVGTGFSWREVTGVSMDNRFDIQRRRANDIQGTRVSALLP